MTKHTIFTCTDYVNTCCHPDVIAPSRFSYSISSRSSMNHMPVPCPTWLQTTRCPEVREGKLALRLQRLESDENCCYCANAIPDALGTSQIRAIHQEVVSLDILAILPRHPAALSKIERRCEKKHCLLNAGFHVAKIG